MQRILSIPRARARRPPTGRSPPGFAFARRSHTGMRPRRTRGAGAALRRVSARGAEQGSTGPGPRREATGHPARKEAVWVCRRVGWGRRPRWVRAVRALFPVPDWTCSGSSAAAGGPKTLRRDPAPRHPASPRVVHPLSELHAQGGEVVLPPQASDVGAAVRFGADGEGQPHAVDDVASVIHEGVAILEHPPAEHRRFGLVLPEERVGETGEERSVEQSACDQQAECE
jgi:hypothetical protein